MNVHDLAASANLLASVVGDMHPRDMSHAYVEFRPSLAGRRLISRWFEGMADTSIEDNGCVQYPLQWVVSWITIGLRVEDLADLKICYDPRHHTSCNDH